MPHTIIYNSEERIIEIKVQGDLSLNEVKEIITEVARVAKEQNCFLVLNDMREATVKLSILEIYGLPKTMVDIAASFGLDVYKFKRAVVIAQPLKVYEFFETVTLNRTQSTKHFFDMDEARKWLSGK